MARLIILFVFLLISESLADCVTQSGIQNNITLQNSCEIGVNVGYGCSIQNAGSVGSSISGCAGRCITPYTCFQNSVVNVTSTTFNCGPYNSYVSFTYDLIKCDQPCEADSVKCILKGSDWKWVSTGNCTGECKPNTCDSTMHCISYPGTYCENVPPSSSITCINGNCYGLGGAKWVSYYDRNCTNECGAIENNRVTGDTAFVSGGSCDDPLNCDPQTQCVDFNDGTYMLYQRCLIGRDVVGNVDTRQSLPQITLTGKGTCKGNGYSTNNGSTGGTGRPTTGPVPVPHDCLTYGVGCPQDTLDYEEGKNANPTNCWCEPFDGLNSVSTIMCPDGSSRVIYMSCLEWQGIYSSSSETPPPSSGSVGGGESSSSTIQISSDSNPFKGDYPNYPTDQPTTNRNVQGVLSGIASIVDAIKTNLIQLKNYVMSTDVFSFDTIPDLKHGDYSSLDTISQDLGFTFDSLFNKIDTSRKIIDTSKYVGVGTCPVINGQFSLCKKIGMFKGNQNVDMKFDFSNFFGFNLCTIIKSIILGFTSVVVFLLSFRVISKSGM